jgi:hypothetical protein
MQDDEYRYCKGWDQDEGKFTHRRRGYALNQTRDLVTRNNPGANRDNEVQQTGNMNSKKPVAADRQFSTREGDSGEWRANADGNITQTRRPGKQSR